MDSVLCDLKRHGWGRGVSASPVVCPPCVCMCAGAVARGDCRGFSPLVPLGAPCANPGFIVGTDHPCLPAHTVCLITFDPSERSWGAEGSRTPSQGGPGTEHAVGRGTSALRCTGGKAWTCRHSSTSFLGVQRPCRCTATPSTWPWEVSQSWEELPAQAERPGTLWAHPRGTLSSGWTT